MNVRSTAITAVLAFAAAAPAASAAQIQTTQACYENADGTVNVVGSGFDPGQPYTVALDGKQLNTRDMTGGDGSVAGSLKTPKLPADAVHVYTLTVTQGAHTATTTFSVTPFFADFVPGAGNPKTLRVRFKLFGFGLVTANPIVYLHYVRPNGRLMRTIPLGRARGVCGQIPRTARMRLFPFAARPGNWRLQFDTSRRYRKGVPGADFLYYGITVTIKKVYG